MCHVAQFQELCLKLDPNMTEDDIDDALEILDENGDGEITYDGAQPHPASPALSTGW